MRSVFSRNSAAVALGLAYAGLAYLLAPAVVNGDGLGYLKATFAGDTYPGHLLLLPIFAMVKDLVQPATAIALLLPLRALMHACGGLAVAIVLVTLWPRGARVAAIGALGFGASFATLAAASDVESYAPALVPVCLFLYALDRDRPWLAAIAGALATLLHIQNGLLGLALVAAVPRWRTRAALATLFFAIVGGAYFIAVQQKGAPWLREVHHGLPYPVSWRTAPATLHGVAKALVYAPYLYEAAALRVGLQTALGLLVLSALLWRRAALTAAERRWLVAWVVPVALLGASYFPSDQERWIGLLPLLWWYVARAPRRSDGALVALLLAANLALWLPVARDRSPRERAHVAQQLLRPGDLVISPGHGWDELVGIYEPLPIARLPLVVQGGLADLGATIAAARRRAPRTILLRMDGSDRDPRGWKDLEKQGYDRQRVATLLPGWRFWIGEGVELLVEGGGAD